MKFDKNTLAKRGLLAKLHDVLDRIEHGDKLTIERQNEDGTKKFFATGIAEVDDLSSAVRIDPLAGTFSVTVRTETGMIPGIVKSVFARRDDVIVENFTIDWDLLMYWTDGDGWNNPDPED